MKHMLLISCLIVLLSCRGTHSNKPKLEVKQRSVDMGVIKLDSAYHLTYALRNTGDADLLIDTVTSSCGCSTPVLSKRILHPEDTTQISVLYKPVEAGKFSKNLVVKTNADTGFTVLTFSGTIVK